MGYATTTTGHRTNVKTQRDTRVIRSMLLNGWFAVLKQTEETTEEEWRGLSYSDANTICVCSESSTLNGVTRGYLGAAVTTQTQSGVSAWMRADACWGTKVSSQMSRDGDTNLYRVVKVTTVLTVSAPSGYLTLL